MAAAQRAKEELERALLNDPRDWGEVRGTM